MAEDTRFLIRNADYDINRDDNSTSVSQTWSASFVRQHSDVNASMFGELTQDSKREMRQDSCDFLTVISAISTAYTNGAYIDMIALNDVHTRVLDGGKDFEVSRYDYTLTAVSPLDQNNQKRIDKLVVKRMKRPSKKLPMTNQEMALFVRELSILHQLRDNDNIVKLRGVGWFYETLDDADITPLLEPSILLEQADGTLEYLLQSAAYLSFQAEMRICKDVATGLLALHRHGIVHGDIKPSNVLAFSYKTSEDGKEVFHYRTKISDFSLARTVGHGSCWFDWGTPRYMAPERHRYLSPIELTLTDVWSLGVLFAAVTERSFELVISGDGAAGLGERIVAQVQRSIQSSAWTPVMVEARRALFDNTLQCEASKRRLHNVVSCLESFFVPITPDSALNASSELLAQFSFFDGHAVSISYETFKQVGCQIRDAIAGSLEVVVQNCDDVRKSSALFELAVCTITGYADPYASASTGLEYLRQSASLGDVRAQGLFYRLQSVLNPNEDLQVDLAILLNWLESAAVRGHQIAMTDLCTLDHVRACKAREASAIRSFNNIVAPVSGEMLVHRMAVMGDVNGLASTLVATPDLLNARDDRGNVPLISASQYSQYNVVIHLLEAGAAPLLVNTNGENFLHYVWCFPFQQLQVILSMCGELKALFTQEAVCGRDVSALAMPLPWLGTPLERAVMMNKVDAVELILGRMNGDVSPNGLILRRALLLAFRLHHEQVQRILIRFVIQISPLRDESLAPVHSTRWEYRGKNVSLLDAVVIGMVSRNSLGLDLPPRWLHLCHLGSDHINGVQRSVWNFLDMVSDSHMREAYVDEAISLALSERWSDALDILLECKAVITDGHANRLASLRPLVWFKFTRDRRYYAGDPSIVPMPPIEVSFVDQIFVREHGTMLHRAIFAGDRATFVMLVDHYQANPSLPATMPDSEEVKGQINVWSLLAHTQHCDLWFTDRLQQTCVQFHLPFEGPADYPTKHLPPLLHALQRRRYGYATWLLRNGASLEEHVSEHTNVIQTLLKPGSVDAELLKFLFPVGSIGGGFQFLPSDLKGKDGFDVFKALYAGYPVHRRTICLGRGGVEREIRIDQGLKKEEQLSLDSFTTVSNLYVLDSCLEHLFNVYPAVPDSPTQWIPVPTAAWLPRLLNHYLSRVRVPYKPRSLLLESIRRGHGSSILLNTTIRHYQVRVVWDSNLGRFPRQNLLELLFFSPLNNIKISAWGDTELWYTHRYLPSLLNLRIILFPLLPFFDRYFLRYWLRLYNFLWIHAPSVSMAPDPTAMWELLCLLVDVLSYLWILVMCAVFVAAGWINLVIFSRFFYAIFENRHPWFVVSSGVVIIFIIIWLSILGYILYQTSQLAA